MKNYLIALYFIALSMYFTSSHAYSYEVSYHLVQKQSAPDKNAESVQTYEKKMILKIYDAYNILHDKLHVRAGVVVFRITIDQDGHLKNLLIQETDKSKDKAVTDAIKSIQFDPIPLGIGPRTMTLNFTTEEFAIGVHRGSVSVSGG